MGQKHTATFIGDDHWASSTGSFQVTGPHQPLKLEMVSRQLHGGRFSHGEVRYMYTTIAGTRFPFVSSSFIEFFTGWGKEILQNADGASCRKVWKRPHCVAESLPQFWSMTEKAKCLVIPLDCTQIKEYNFDFKLAATTDISSKHQPQLLDTASYWYV